VRRVKNVFGVEGIHRRKKVARNSLMATPKHE
jgi:hypothetical protein